MKELVLYIRPDKLEMMKKILVDQFSCGGMTVSNVMGCGNQKGFTDEFTGIRSNVNLLPKLKVEVVVRDKDVETIIEDICSEASTGEVGDGKIIVKSVENVVRIRTGEKGEAAI